MVNSRALGVLLAALILGLTASSAQSQQAFPAVDRQVIAKSPGTRFIENIFWASKADIAAKRVATSLVRKDIEQFQVILARALKKEFLPNSDTIEDGVIPLQGFRNGDDYLLLRYQSGDYDFQIESGMALYILVTPRKSEGQTLDKMADYIESTAQSVLNVPAVDEASRQAEELVAPSNLGEWRFGERYYQGYPPPKHWYSGITWWSDGRSVLFQTSAWLQEDFTHGHEAWSDALAPGTFAYKKEEAAKKATQ